MGTHITDIKGIYKVATSPPSDPQAGDRFFETDTGCLYYYDGSTWYGHAYTSTSSSSTSTTSTSSSTSTTTSTTTSTSTSTTSTSTSL